jgi:hypothetical protein
MAKKTFKIGECAVGGIIVAEVVGFSGDIVQIKALDWNTKKVVSENLVMSTERNAQWKLDNYLNELTTSYYASKILDWIKTKVKFDYTF